MPENAEVAVFEDNNDYQFTAGVILRDFGHAVVAKATNLSEAEAIMGELESGKLKVDAVLIDGNLDNEETNTQHGAEFAQRLKGLGIPTIEIASQHQGFADYSSPKNTYFTNLGEIVTDL